MILVHSSTPASIIALQLLKFPLLSMVLLALPSSDIAHSNIRKSVCCGATISERGVKSRPLCILGKGYPTELHP